MGSLECWTVSYFCDDSDLDYLHCDILNQAEWIPTTGSGGKMNALKRPLDEPFELTRRHLLQICSAAAAA
jgi:hypothetical protein